jgi:hypothetical protein
MADIFREIDEEVRRERAFDVWRKHGNKIVGLAVLIVIAVAGWRAWQYFETQKAQEAGAKFEQALQDSKAGKTAEAEQVLSDLAKSSTSGYQKLARLREAGEIAKADAAKAVEAYDAIAADGSVDAAMRDVARLRAAMLLVDTASGDDLQKRLSPVIDAGTFAPNAHELIGLAALKAGDYEAAGKAFDQIITDRNAPPSLRQRAELLLALVKAGPLKPAS